MLIVGNALQWRDTATTLTDSSKGSYRRLSIVDDRLVGYLSLGPSQPDGLAIKRLINQGHSIRHIKKALLKGNFDARKYFSHQSTSAAHYMVNTGTLPTPDALESPLQAQSLARTSRETGPLAASDKAVTQNGSKSGVNTHPLYDTHIHYVVAQQKTIAIPEEYESLFFEGGLAPDQPKQLPPELPCVIESTLVALPSNTSRRTSGGLWSYSDKLPAVKAKPRNGQFIIFPQSDKGEKEHPQERIHPSSSLWSYTDKHVAVKKGH